MLTAHDIRDFNGYLKACTDAQVLGVFAKERDAGRDEYAALAEAEAEARGLDIPQPDEAHHTNRPHDSES